MARTTPLTPATAPAPRTQRITSLRRRVLDSVDSSSAWVRARCGPGAGVQRGHMFCVLPIAAALLQCSAVPGSMRLSRLLLRCLAAHPHARLLPQTQEVHISEALGGRYWLVASRHMFQTRMLLFARMNVVPFVQE